MKYPRVLQLIDSLDAGGGERMAVQLANALSEKIHCSALVSSRRSGILEKDISSEVIFLYLNKKHSLDIVALKRLRRFVKTYHINIIHAHSTSFFMATLLKLSLPKLKLIWHDHYGLSDNLEKRSFKILKLCSLFFSHILSVNLNLKTWAENHLKCKNVSFIQNFSLGPLSNESKNKIHLKGPPSSYKIIHVANLRPQKDHLTALNAIKKLKDKAVNFSYHIIGAYDENTFYYRDISTFIKNNQLEKHVFIYGGQSHINELLNQADVGLLSSFSEGLPVSLIEYAQANLPVVVTDVGQCRSVVGDFAQVIKPKDDDALFEALQFNINYPKHSQKLALELYKKVTSEFNADLILQKLLTIYDEVL